MGQFLSLELFEDDVGSNPFFERPKNFDFYFNKKRITKIPRRYYPNYKKGYLYGYYIDENYWVEVNTTNFNAEMKCLLEEKKEEYRAF